MQNKLSIFVIMPFGGQFDLIYRHLIKLPLENKCYAVARADDEPEHQYIIKEIIQSIWQADLIIADLTGRNANVCYELGIAHSLKKPTIQITQRLDDILFSLRPYEAKVYSIKSDGTSDLTDHILGIIERDNYKFSNPVNDSINAGPKKIITIPRSSDIDDNADVASDDSDIGRLDARVEIDDGVDDNEDVESDDSDYGLLDARVEAEDAMREIASITREIASDISEIGEKTQARTEEANELMSKPNQQRLQSKLLRVLKNFASDLDEFSGNVNQKTPALKEAWIKMDQGLGYTLLVSRIKNQSDYETVLSLLKGMNDLRNTASGAIKSGESFRESYENLIGLSRASNRALRNSVKTIDRLLDEFKLGNSVLTRLINLAYDMIDRYNDDMIDDNDDDDSA